MSIYKSSTLAMIPTAYKDGKLYSVRPTDGSGDFTFSRGTTATRVDVNGLIEKGRENRLLQSNQFDTTWGTSVDISVTSGQSGYDGTNDAWLLKRSSNASRYITQAISLGAGVHTYSVYAKPESENFLFMWAYDNSASVSAYFDLSNGSVGITAGAAYVDASIEAAGNGYYRCSLTFNYSSTLTQVRLYPAVSDGSVTGGVTDAGIYIQDAQLEAGLVATDYIETGTSAAQSGILEDMPRLDYSGSCPALLLEPQRTNLMVQSEGFSTTAWTANATDTNVTANATSSPEGLQNAAEIEFTSSIAKIYDQFTNVASSIHIGSVWLKNKDIGSIRVRIEGGAPSILGRVDVNLANGTLSNAVGDFTPTIEDYGDGWYRVAVGDTGSATIASPSFSFDYLSSTGSFYAYGAQVEAGSYPTSYIPTYGSSVTRAKDSAAATGLGNVLGSTEGTIYLEVAALANDLSERRFALSNGTTGNVARVGFTNVGNRILAVLYNGSNQCVLTYAGADITQTNKIAFTYAENDFALYVNGQSRSTDASGVTFSAGTLSEIHFNEGDGNGNESYGRFDQVVIFPTRLTDTELASLTTL